MFNKQICPKQGYKIQDSTVKFIIHIDLVDQLPVSQSYKNMLTVIDRFSRWPEAYLITDIIADSLAKLFYRNCVRRFGAPIYVNTDHGSQFESALYLAFLYGSPSMVHKNLDYWYSPSC